MDRWKAEVERVREKRKSRGEESRRGKSRRKKIQAREKVGKSRNTVLFQWFVAPEGRKVGRCGASWPDERWKIARRCGTKHISKSKCTKHTSSGPLLAVEMSKKCTLLWRAAHFEVKNVKNTRGFGPLLEVQMSFRVAGARDCAPSQKWAKREGFVAFPKAMAGVGHLKRIPSIYLSLSLSLSICLSIYLQAWKQSNSARLPQILNLTT